MQNAAQTCRRLWLATASFALISALLVAPVGAAGSQDPQQPDSYNSNSGVPAEKPARSTPTAADRIMTQKIRKAIAADKALSAEGRRVKVTSLGGKVTLEGAVQSEAERTSIFTKAADIAGGPNVANNITISTPQ